MGSSSWESPESQGSLVRKDRCIQGVPDVSRFTPLDRESDSALAESLSGNTLVDQSSLIRWMLFVLVRYITSLQVRFHEKTGR